MNIDRDHITLAGDRALLDVLAAYYDEWCKLGSPRITDFTMQFVPLGDANMAASGSSCWVVKGRYFAHVFSVD